MGGNGVFDKRAFKMYEERFCDKEWLTYVKDTPRAKHIIYKANLICQNIFLFDDPLDMECCYIPHYFKDIDWVFTPNGDDEWIYMLNRQGFMVELSQAFLLTGEQKYIQKWKELVFDWIEKVGIKDKSNHTAWRIIDTGIRCRNWVTSLLLFQHLAPLSEVEEQQIKYSLESQIKDIFANSRKKHILSNWGVLGVTGILAVDLLYPNILAKEERGWAWKQFEEQLRIQFYRDGYHWEQSPLYQFEVLMSSATIMMHYDYLERETPFSIRERLLNGVQASYYLEDLSGKLLALHDSDPVDIRIERDCLNAVFSTDEAVRTDEYLLYVGMKFKHNQVDSEKKSLYSGEASGNIIYKNPEKDVFYSLHNGRHGSGHGHAALGNFSFSLGGTPVIVDPGRGTYTESPIRNYLKSEYAHNVIILDGHPTTVPKGSWEYERVGNPVAQSVYEDDEVQVSEVVYARKTSEHTNACFRRIVLFFKESFYVVILDIVDAIGVHMASRSFQLHPSVEVTEEGESLNLFSAGSNVFMQQLQADHIKVKGSLYSPQYNQLQSNKMVVAEQSFEDVGIFATILSKERVHLQEVTVKQDGVPAEVKKDYMHGFEIKGVKDNEKVHIFYAHKDTFKGNKLYFYEETPLYGRLNIKTHQGNKRIY